MTCSKAAGQVMLQSSGSLAPNAGETCKQEYVCELLQVCSPFKRPASPS